MKFLITAIVLVIGFCNTASAQVPVPDPMFGPPLPPDEQFILDHQTPPVTIIDGVPVIGVYGGPGFDPTPDLGIQPWPVPTPDPNYAIDCCERLNRLDWMRNQYDIMEENLYTEIDLLDTYLTQGPLDAEQADIVLSLILRIAYFEAALESFGDLIRHQAQVYDVICDCE